MHPALVVVLLVIVAVGTYALFALFHPNEVDAAGAPKRFGLKEAEAAARYVSTADAARSVMAVVVGVLGYANTVADDLTDVVSKAATFNDEANIDIDEANKEIENLKETVKQLQVEINDRETRLAETKRIAALFTA